MRILLGMLVLGLGAAGAQQTATTTLGPIKTPLMIFKQQTCASVAGVANLTLMCYDVSGAIQVNVNNTGWVDFSGSGCSNCVVTDGSGNATIAGNFTALELILSGSGPLDLTTPCGSVSAPPGGFGLWGMGSGCVPVIYPSTLTAVVPIAYQDGFGNVYQNANTATAAATVGSACSGHYALGVDVNWNAICDTSTFVLIPTITDPGATASNLALFGTTTQIQAHINGGSLVTLLRKDTAQATWTCPVYSSASFLVAQGYCSWTPPAGVTVVAFDLATANNPTCTAYPTYVVWDQTAGAGLASSAFSITTNGSSTYFYTQVTGSAAVPVGHRLVIQITGTPACATDPLGVVATVTYQMS